MERALRTSDAIIEISADAIISINEAYQIIRYNNGACEIFGYSAEEILGRDINVLIPERFRAGHPAQIRGFAASPTVARRMGERRQISALRKNGQEFPAEASISKTRVDDQWIFTVALRDITDRVRSQRRQEFLAQASGVLNGSLDAQSTISSVASLSVPVLGDWCVVFLSDEGETFHRALAVHSSPDREAEMTALMDMPFTPEPAHPVLKCLNAGESILIPTFDDEALNAWADSAEHKRVLQSLSPASAIVVPLHARGRQIGGIAYFRDRDNPYPHDNDDLALAAELARRAGMAIDNARLYELAQNAIRARDDVLAVVSHDLGNPLAAIRLSAKVLSRHIERQAARKEPVDEMIAEQAGNIRASVDHMDRLIMDRLDIRRIDSGFMALELARVSVGGLLQEVFESYHGLADARGIAFSIDSAESEAEMGEVIADHARMLQVFSNMVGNALKFTAPGQSVSIGAHRVPAGVAFHVADTGAGIPQEHLPHIFDRYWQARRTGRQSIGLGLAIVKGIIDAHEGTIRVESELGAGTTFTITLRSAEQSAE
jgi:PAS domain S-box-containing protein